MTPERLPPLWSLLLGWSRGHSYPNPGVQRCALLRRDLHTCWLPKAEKWQGGLWLHHHLPTVLQLWCLRSFAMLNFFNRLNKIPFQTDWKRKKSPLEKIKEMMTIKGKLLFKFLTLCREKKPNVEKAAWVVCRCWRQTSMGTKQRPTCARPLQLSLQTPS